ncbi:hypothetical protein [Streptomyces sp. NPDC050121]|uniref:hypothetical protein n=1 Tax=Streptomyces sp. NPDC050121 TaxID=3365601 RepID=UPI0037B253CD
MSPKTSKISETSERDVKGRGRAGALTPARIAVLVLAVLVLAVLALIFIVENTRATKIPVVG